MTKTNQFKVLAVVAATALALCLVALVAVRPAQAAFPGTNGKIAFQRYDVWVKNPSLSSPETNLLDNSWDATFSPDGSRVAFVHESPGPEIFIANANGTGTPRRLTNNSVVDANPAWSHDGTRIAFEQGGQVWTMNADGTNKKALTTTELATDNPDFDPRGPSLSPSWSVPLPGAPDGKIAFWHQGWLWTMLADGSSKDDLDYTCPTESGGICDTAVGDPTFSPDGSQIAAEYYGDIFTVSSSGGQTSLLTPPEGGTPVSERYPAWSPDGKKIAFQGAPTNGSSYQIYLASITNRTAIPTKITENGGEKPDWQPIPVCTMKVNAANDALVGTIGKDVLCGDSRNNTINGAGGNDIVLGNGGNDRLTGGPGNDILNGGPGTDTALYSGTTAVRASLTTEFAAGVGSDVLLGIENLSGSSAIDRFTGNAGRNMLSGLGGNDVLDARDGTGGNDRVDGGAGASDTCRRDAGDTVLNCP